MNRTSLIEYISYPLRGSRAGGFEPAPDWWRISILDDRLKQWKPQALIVMDPDVFLYDSFRVPGFNGIFYESSLYQSLRVAGLKSDLQPVPPPVPIGCLPIFGFESLIEFPPSRWLRFEPFPILFRQASICARGFRVGLLRIWRPVDKWFGLGLAQRVSAKGE